MREELTTKDIESIRKPTIRDKKGWVKNINGNEYVYDYQIPNTMVMLKVLSTVRVDAFRKHNRNSDMFRVFAVVVDADGKVKRGLIKSKTVPITVYWKVALEKFVMIVYNEAKRRLED